jgi:molecular chaperone GrpE
MSEENEPVDAELVDAGAGTPTADLENVDAAMENQPQVELSEVDQLKAQLADAEKRVLMAQADLDNFRKRNRREMLDQVKYASLGLMNELLESVDNLQRAIEAYQQDPNGDGLAQGVAMVSSQISKALENHGCKKIEAVGAPFDPNHHQALQMQPSDDHPANTVMMDLRPGFLLHDRLIRPAQVFVSTGAAKEA